MLRYAAHAIMPPCLLLILRYHADFRFAAMPYAASAAAPAFMLLYVAFNISPLPLRCHVAADAAFDAYAADAVDSAAMLMPPCRYAAMSYYFRLMPRYCYVTLIRFPLMLMSPPPWLLSPYALFRYAAG